MESESAVQAYRTQKHGRGKVVKPSGQQFTALETNVQARQDAKVLT
jgi:hypothetical protein